MASIKEKTSGLISTAKEYWNVPPKGNYVSYKEILNIGVAGFGVHWTSTLATVISLDASNFLIGACIGLKPMDLYIMTMVSNLIGIPIGLFRGWYFDNHHMKGGKFIPFLLRCPLPIILLSAIFVWLPFENWEYVTKAIVVEAFFVLISTLSTFYSESFSFFQQIVTPNAQERATVMSISQIIYSLAPSITNLIIPTIAGLTWGLNNIWTYRVIYPIFSVIGFIVNTIFFHKVKERLILPKKKLEYVSIFDSIREVAKNKYFWIINAATWIGFLEGAYSVTLGWSFVYSHNGEKAAQLGIANTIIGNAALWSMLLAPIVIKKFGKRNLLIWCNICNVLLFTILLFVYKNLILLCILMFFNGFINTFGNIYMPNINADMRDYHQWKTGVRIDGLFGTLGIISTVIGYFTGMVLPSIYEHMGLNGDYDVLYNDTMRNDLFRVLIMCSIIGAVLNVIPYLFYDLTESKHQGYVNVLKIRAMFEDYGNGMLDDNELIESMEIINTAKEYEENGKLVIDKSQLQAAKKMPKSTKQERMERKQAIKEEKKKIKQIENKNEFYDSMPIVLEELEKFSTPRYKKQLESAFVVNENGPLFLYDDAETEMKEAKKLPKSTKQEREIRADAINLARTKKVSANLIIKYGDKLVKPDEAVKSEIESRETHSLKEMLKARRELKAYVKLDSAYRRASAPYEHARNLIIQAENYTHLSDIEDMYADIVSTSKDVLEFQ